MIFCEQCGTQLKDTAKFCNKCGAPVTSAEEQDQGQNEPDNFSIVRDIFDAGMECKNAGQKDEAISRFTEVIRLDPEASPAFFMRGEVFMEKTEYDNAIADFTKVIQLTTEEEEDIEGLADAYTSRGNAYLYKEDFDSAIADYSKTIELCPENIDAYVFRGFAYLEKADIPNARFDLEKARQIDGNFEGAVSLAKAIDEAINKSEEETAEESGFIFCEQCGTQLKDTAKFCSKCGTPVESVTAVEQVSAPLVCAKCKAQLEEGEQFCPICGAKAEAGAQPSVMFQAEVKENNSVETAEQGEAFYSECDKQAEEPQKAPPSVQPVSLQEPQQTVSTYNNKELNDPPKKGNTLNIIIMLIIIGILVYTTLFM